MWTTAPTDRVKMEVYAEISMATTRVSARHPMLGSSATYVRVQYSVKYQSFHSQTFIVFILRVSYVYIWGMSSRISMKEVPLGSPNSVAQDGALWFSSGSSSNRSTCVLWTRGRHFALYHMESCEWCSGNIVCQTPNTGRSLPVQPLPDLGPHCWQ